MGKRKELEFLCTLADNLAGILGLSNNLALKSTLYSKELADISDSARELCEKLRARVDELKEADPLTPEDPQDSR